MFIQMSRNLVCRSEEAHKKIRKMNFYMHSFLSGGAKFSKFTNFEVQIFKNWAIFMYFFIIIIIIIIFYILILSSNGVQNIRAITLSNLEIFDFEFFFFNR